MGTKITPYKNSEQSKTEQVRDMFDKIAGKYDFFNHFFTLGIDKSWRRKAVAELNELAPKQILEIATGTGDVAIELLKLNPEKITATDISEGMMDVGRKKVGKLGDSRIEFMYADCQALDFPDNSFDAVTVSYGVRNFEQLELGLSEMYRVLKPGGRAVILELSKPRVFPIKQLYNFYFNVILPGIGRLSADDKNAYSYLPESVRAFPDGESFTEILRNIGFKDTKWVPLTLGITSIYTGDKL